MAFHQGYGAPQRQYNMLGDDSRYPQTVGAGTAAQNPFESQSSMQPGYPPTHQAMYDAPHGNDSTWSVHDYGQSPFGDDGTKETATLQRGSDNPYASDYRKPRSAGSWKKWTLIGLVVLLVVGGIAGGIAGWRVSANNKDNSASGTSSSGGSGKMQYSESLPRAQNSLEMLSSASPSLSSCPLPSVDGTAKAVKWNPQDPSQFEKDDRCAARLPLASLPNSNTNDCGTDTTSCLRGAHSLKPIFYGLAYTPFNALEPWCGASLNNVTEDILLMSQMTSTPSPLPDDSHPVTRLD